MRSGTAQNLSQPVIISDNHKIPVLLASEYGGEPDDNKRSKMTIMVALGPGLVVSFRTFNIAYTEHTPSQSNS